MADWQQNIDLSHPCWADYRPLLSRLAGEAFPAPAQLNDLLPPGASTAGGQAIRFVAADTLGPVDYETHIHRTGEVSTRRNNWHDLFNALAWCLLPQLKAAMNAMHCRHPGSPGKRGPQRDALTLFDECGVIVVGSERDALEALARRDWPSAFREHAPAWGRDLNVVVCGHALLEKFLSPYKAITAHAIFLKWDPEAPQADRAGLTDTLDSLLARRLLEGRLFSSPAGLSPLPLMGIPGWWPEGVQDDAFYADRSVFRAPPTGAQVAAIRSFPTAALTSAAWHCCARSGE